MPPLRVLLLTPDFPPQHGGIQRLLERLVHHGEHAEYEVMAPASAGASTWDAQQGYRILRTPGTGPRQLVIARLNAAAVDRARRTRPDVVLAGHVVTAPAALAVRRLLGIPFVLYLYALEVPQRPRLVGAAGRGAEAVIAISRYTAELARAAGVPPERIRIVPPGVDQATVPPAGNGQPPERPRVLTVARLHDRYKGFDVMTRALPLIRARVPDAEWVIIGEGRLREEIARQAEAHGAAAAVRFCGAVSDAERDEWYARSQVFAMPSRLPPGSAGEGFGIVYLEAGTHGLPSVAGNVGGALDAVADGETGRLVAPTSHLAVADAVAGLLEEPALAREMGAAAARFAERFAWPRVAGDVEAVLLDAAGRR
jgi:phosphatidylinositol alpha-1,6-mannosyltransferase